MLKGDDMANLVVRNLDTRIVDALKQRAARHGRSAEAEHRAILEEALLKSRKKSFAEVLASMPAVGQDEDFERMDDEYKEAHVFG
jgi:plasmid stability protein